MSQEGQGGFIFRCCKILEGISQVNQGQNSDMGEGGIKNGQKNSNVFYGWSQSCSFFIDLHAADQRVRNTEILSLARVKPLIKIDQSRFSNFHRVSCQGVQHVRRNPGNPRKTRTQKFGFGFHLIKFPVSQFITEKTRKFWVGSGFGYFQIFAHSNHYYAIFNDHYAIFSVNNTIAFFTFSIIQEDQPAGQKC